LEKSEQVEMSGPSTGTTATDSAQVSRIDSEHDEDVFPLPASLSCLHASVSAPQVNRGLPLSDDPFDWNGQLASPAGLEKEVGVTYAKMTFIPD
jgi:hypothetical protein